MDQLYSFTAIASHPVALENPRVMLGEGFNAFNAVTADLDGLLERLRQEDVQVLTTNQLSGLPPTTDLPALTETINAEDHEG